MVWDSYVDMPTARYLHQRTRTRIGAGRNSVVASTRQAVIVLHADDRADAALFRDLGGSGLALGQPSIALCD